MLLREQLRKARLLNSDIFDDLHCYVVYDDDGAHYFSTEFEDVIKQYGDRVPRWIHATKSLIDYKFLVEIWL